MLVLDKTRMVRLLILVRLARAREKVVQEEVNLGYAVIGRNTVGVLTSKIAQKIIHQNCVLKFMTRL